MSLRLGLNRLLSIRIYKFWLQFQLTECVQLYRATWDEPEPPSIPKWRQKLAEPKEESDENEEGAGSYRPLKPLQPKRETLVITLSDDQWTALKNAARTSLKKIFKNANTYVEQIGEFFLSENLVILGKLGKVFGEGWRTFLG